LGAWLDRPFSERERGRAFALAATVLVLAAVLLNLAADRPDPGPGAARAAGAPRSAPALAQSRPSPPPRVRRRVLRVARRFLTGYLAYLYGRGSASEIPATTARLRAGLALHRPRLSAPIRHRHPRIVATLSAALPAGRGWLVTATVEDGGPEPYPVAAAVEERAGRLVVTRLMEEG
jgi:hypothetical protein